MIDRQEIISSLLAEKLLSTKVGILAKGIDMNSPEAIAELVAEKTGK